MKEKEGKVVGEEEGVEEERVEGWRGQSRKPTQRSRVPMRKQSY